MTSHVHMIIESQGRDFI